MAVASAGEPHRLVNRAIRHPQQCRRILARPAGGRLSAGIVDPVQGFLVDQVLIFGVTGEPGGDEWAERDDPLAARPHVVEGSTSEGRPEPFTLMPGIDLGVDEIVATTPNLIDGHAGHLPVQLQYIAVVVGVISDFDLVLVTHQVDVGTSGASLLPGRSKRLLPTRITDGFGKQELDLAVDAPQLVGRPFLQGGVESGIDPDQEALALRHRPSYW
jgi:hypothetical protein